MGNSEICGWKVAPGYFFVQTRCPDLARKLSRRSDTALVAYSVFGGYLRIYGIPAARPQFVRALLSRYLKVTNAPFSDVVAPPGASQLQVRVKIAERTKKSRVQGVLA